MARIRTIKPDFWTDEKIGSLKRDERLLFIGLWNLADDQGVVKSSAGYIKGQLFSYDDELRSSTVTSWLASLTKARLLIPFTFNGEGYFLIRTFHEHQLINRPSKPKFTSQHIQSILDNTHGALSECSQPEIEGKGKEEEIERKGKEAAVADPRFDKKLILENPFSEKFISDWINWKEYKRKEHKFLFKSIESEQAALNELVTLSEGNEDTAREIVMQSLAKGWKGFFPLKTEANGHSKTSRQPAGAKINGSKLDTLFDERYGKSGRQS